MAAAGYAVGAAADLGDLPGWISAVASLGALVFAATAGIVAYRVYHIEVGRDRQMRAELTARDRLARRAQADLVSAWWGCASDLAGDRTDPDQWGIFVRNASQVPVYHAYVNVVNADNSELTFVIELPVVPPGEERTFHRPPADIARRLASEIAQGRVAEFRVVVAFTDAAEVRWIRDQRGNLHECDDALTIFTDLSRSEALLPFVEQYGRRQGVDVRVRAVHWANLRTEFLAASTSGVPPDLVVGAHDWIGSLAREGVIAPLGLPADRLAIFLDLAVRAMTYADDCYGIPYAVENLALIRNTALVPAPVPVIEDLVEIGERLVLEGRATHALAVPVGSTGNPYHLQPLVSAGGGALFGVRGDGTCDLADVRLDHPDTVASFQRIQALGAKHRNVLRSSMRVRAATALFAAGTVPFLISGPWAVSTIAEAGIPFAVDPLPGYRGGPPGIPFIGVQGLYLAAGATNATFAREFLDGYLSRTQVALALHRADSRPPALRSAIAALAHDPLTQGFRAAAAGGIIMPSGPGMADVWEVVGLAEASIIGGADVERTLKGAARTVRHHLGAAAAHGEDAPGWPRVSR